jgi:hypothetical protein
LKPFKKNKILGIDENFEILESRDFMEFNKFKFVYSLKIFENVKRNYKTGFRVMKGVAGVARQLRFYVAGMPVDAHW